MGDSFTRARAGKAFRRSGRSTSKPAPFSKSSVSLRTISAKAWPFSDKKLIQLTWLNGKGFVYDKENFRLLGEFAFEPEGWGLTYDGKRLILSDGTAELRFLDPATFKESGRLTVTDGGRPVVNLNELEFVRGEILANIWMKNVIARIDPARAASKAGSTSSRSSGRTSQAATRTPSSTASLTMPRATACS